jgi:D-glycero-D-manno-heptose 1,7-bisphosphate phosphatase
MSLPEQTKILTVEEADRWVEQERAAGSRIGFTCGSFDLMHAGHAHYLAEARRLCDRLLVAVNSDASVRAYKDPLRPVNPWVERAYLVAALHSVDAVTVLEEKRPLTLLLRWKPDLYIKGGDYKTTSLRSAEAVEAYGGRVAVIPPAFGSSSTKMMERIQALALHALPQAAPPVRFRGLVLLDRDGTLIRDVPFLYEPDKVELLPGVPEGLLELQRAGFRLAIVTNQQGIGLGYFGIQEFIAVNQRLLRMLHENGVTIWRVFFCPHSLAEECECRKPRVGMLRRAMEESGTDPGDCYLVGDSASDMAAARAAGCHAISVGPAVSADADFTAAGFTTAVTWISGEQTGRTQKAR